MYVFFLLLTGVIEASLLVTIEGNKVEYPHQASPSPKCVKVLSAILKDIGRGNIIIDSKNLTLFYDTITKKYGKKIADTISKKMREKKYNNTELVANKSGGGEVLLPMAGTGFWLCILREIGLDTYPTSIITRFKAEILAEEWEAAAALILGIGADIAEPELLAGELAFAALFLC